MTAFLADYAHQRAAVLHATETVGEAWRRYRHVSGLDAEGEEGLLALDLEAVRVATQRHQLSIGVFGLIKRGKSTLVNALVGSEVSGAHVTPETAVPVHVEHGAEPAGEVRFVDGRVQATSVDDALTYTSQKHNENNHRGVLVVRQRVDSPLLANGVRLVDTPGLDDAEADDTYTRRTLEEVRRVDAALVTLLSPPTVGATEVAFLETLAAEGPRHVVFVLNMYPQHYHDPVTRPEIVAYVRGQLGARLAGRDLHLFPVCAKDAWDGRQDPASGLWDRSGVPELLRFVEEQLTDRARRDIVGDAAATVRRSAQAMLDQARRRRALLTQPAALADHRDAVRSHADEASNQLRTAVALAIADADRRHRRLRVAVEQSFAEARAGLRRAATEEELKRELRQVRRGVELRCTVAGRGLSESLQHTIGELQEALARAVASSDELAGTSEDVRVEVSEGALTGLRLGDAAGRLDPAVIRSLGSAAAGGALVGGMGILAVGALLGPLGLVGGALAGWRLGGAASLGGTLDRLRGAADERVAALADDVLGAFDSAAGSALDELRRAALRRVDAYAHELLTPIVDIEAVARDPERVELERRAVAGLFTDVAAAMDQIDAVVPDTPADDGGVGDLPGDDAAPDALATA